MRIAQVAPLVESVPPRHYGGTERIISYLTEELVRFGHKVTLFASGDSVTGAELVPVCRQSFRQNKRAKDYLSREVLLMDHLMERAGEFDLIHFHTGCLHYLICRHLPVPNVTTLHGRLDTLELRRLYERFRQTPIDLDFECAAHTMAMRQLAGHGVPWVAARYVSVSSAAGRLSGLPRTRVARKTS